MLGAREHAVNNNTCCVFYGLVDMLTMACWCLFMNLLLCILSLENAEGRQVSIFCRVSPSV